ncbi:MAG: hypothetical protein HFACDABA_01777 [Anaerolineales bacterium]|nr:hypothetical protein [Anaerolineales bacterium]
MKLVTILFALLIILIIVLADTGHLGALGFVYDFPLGDKAGHFLIFGTFSCLINRTLLRSLHTSDPKRAAVIASILLALAIGLEEWAQRFFPQRSSDWVDLFFSYAGVALGAWLGFRKGRVAENGTHKKGA